MKVPKNFVCNFQIIAMTKICITFYQVTPDITSYDALPLFITPYHTLSPRLKTKPFSFGNFKISSQAPLSLSHLSRLVIPYHTLSPRSETKPLDVDNFKLIPRPLISYHILSRLVTHYHTLSPRLELKPFDVDNFKISSHYYVFITFCFRYRQ